MTLSVSHGLRARQFMAALKGWLSGKARRVWMAELTGDYAGNDLGKSLGDVDSLSAALPLPKENEKDKVLAYKREVEELYALRRDAIYGRRNRAWLFQRGVKTRMDGHFAAWTAYSRRNTGEKVLTAASTDPGNASETKLEEVI